MRIIYLIFLVLWLVLPAKVSMSNPNRICFFPEPGDTNSFGSSVVVNDKYLAIGDPRANKVIIYTPDGSGQWNRIREILPPVDLNLDEDSSIFGNNLELDGDVLTISARTKNPDVPRDDLSSSQVIKISPTYSYLRYSINLKTNTELQPIDLLVQRDPKSNLVRFNLLRQGKIEQFVLPDMGDENFDSFDDLVRVYGNKIALHQNLLLVGYSSSYDETGGAWLFDLAQPQTKPSKLAVEDVALGNTVAISQEFAAVGFSGVTWYYPRIDRRKSPKTLIKNLSNGSSTVIDSFGKLSLSGNILAVMRPRSPDCEQRPLLEVFHLDENTTPHLVLRRTNIDRAKVQNGFLILSKEFHYCQVCIKTLH
jgi:hypothetical protein